MKRLVTAITLAILLVGLALLALIDRDVSFADTSILNNKVISSVSKARNSLASATITITVYAVADK